MDVAQARARAQVRGQVLRCADCPAPFVGPTPATFAILVDPLDKQTDSKLRSVFSGLRIDLAEHALIVSVGQCREHVGPQLGLAGSRWVLALGASALHYFRPDLKVTHLHGRPFYAYPDQAPEEKAMVVFPAFHPGSVLGYRSNERPWRADLGEFWRLVGLGRGWFDARDTRCWKCGKDWWVNTNEGLPWCEEHGRAEFERLDEVEAQEQVRAQMREQGGMLVEGEGERVTDVAPKGLTRNQGDKRRRELALR